MLVKDCPSFSEYSFTVFSFHLLYSLLHRIILNTVNATNENAMIKTKLQSLIYFATCLAVCLGLLMISPDAKGSSDSLSDNLSNDLFKGKRILIVGDSIQIRSIGAYIKRASLSLGAEEVNNKAISGATLAHTNKKSVYRQVASTADLGEYDYYFIAAGYNDYGFSVSPGFRKGKLTTKSIRTTCGALRKMIRLIDTAHRNDSADKDHPDGWHPRIIVVSPLYSYFHCNKSLTRGCDEIRNDRGKTLAAYRGAIHKVAEKYDFVKVLDGRTLARRSEMKSLKNTRDRLHPRVPFAKKLAKRTAKWIIRNYGTPKPTFGVAGTGSKSQSVIGSKTGADSIERHARRILKTMTLRQKVGQLIIAGTSDPSPKLMKNRQYCGYLLHEGCFKNSTPAKFKTRIRKVQKAAKINAFTAIDEEGGPFTIVSDFKVFRKTPFLSPRELRRLGGLRKIRKDATKKSLYLKRLGINTNFAPVGDTPYDSSNYIWKRSFSSDPVKVSKYVTAVVGAMNKCRMVNSVKHFPGYGANLNTHDEISLDARPLNVFESRDLLPFAAGIKAGCSMIMVSHNVVSAFDSSMPASLSKPVHIYLRKTMGYKGIIISDSVSMQGAKQYITDPENLAVRAINAGNDMICGPAGKAYTGILKAARSGTISKKRINRSVLRILKLKLKMGIVR